MSLLTHTEALKDHVLLNVIQLKDGYSHVTMHDEGQDRRWPVAWCDSAMDGTPLLDDKLREYVYFRQHGPESMEVGPAFGGRCSYNVQYPVRMVAHMKADRGGNPARAYLDGFIGILASYKWENGGVSHEIESAEPDKRKVWDQETEGVEYRLNRDDILISIDFTLTALIVGNCVDEVFCLNEDPPVGVGLPWMLIKE